ncbi:hypothetical protein BGZ83_006293 [Gryganskiella cystojenkinii]|nr:hypothetical protein BGZ83_006293 [Gryganskiella cystojenkinii]
MHALNIPEILEHIAAYLAPDDLARNCRVCQSFFEPMAAQLWKRIECLQEDSMIRAHIPFPSRYAIFVRDLIISGSDNHPRVLDHHYCTGLTRLTTFSHQDICASDIETILGILNHNPGLQSITFRWQDLDWDLVTKLVAAMSQCKNLKYLDLTVDWISTTGALEFLLRSLPGLEHFRVLEWNQAAGGLYAVQALSGKQDSWPMAFPLTEDTNKTEIRYGLRRLQIETCVFSFHPLNEIVRASPGLEYLGMIDWDEDGPEDDASDFDTLSLALHESCLRLEDLMISSRWMKPDHLYRLLDLSRTTVQELGQDHLQTPIIKTGRFLPLQSLHVVCNGIRYQEVLELVVSAGWVLSETLEVLEVDDIDGPNNGGGGRGSTLLAVILQTFSCLRSVRVEKASILAEDLLDDLADCATLRDPAVDENRTRMFVPWACKDLKSLEISIASKSPSWFPPDVPDCRRQLGVLSSPLDRDKESNRVYPLYEQIKAQLDSLKSLDQRGIRYIP